jgi:UDP-N-acetyl-2-amino-2-deoxyglucuronate dehydrogenase
MNEAEYCHIRDYTMPVLAESNPPNDYGPLYGFAANHHYIYENISNVIYGKASITTIALEGMKVVKLLRVFVNA